MLICPICKKYIKLRDKSYYCDNNHCFDISKKGYINLLMSQASHSKVHGDDKLMTIGRRDFLNKGYYEKLLERISFYAKNSKYFVDVGCGEGYYTCGIFDRIMPKEIIGVDISKDIISSACTRAKGKDITFVVASCSKIPVADNSTDCIISVFAPIDDNEFCRILSDDGIIIRVTPGINHLIELKKAVYDNPLVNQPVDLHINGLKIISDESIDYSFIADNSDIKNLFMMTPYYYKTSKQDKQKLDNIEKLSITAQFKITIYKKRAD